MKTKRILASILALALTASSLPSHAWAANIRMAPTAPVSVIPGGVAAAGTAGRIAPLTLNNFTLGAAPLISAGQIKNSLPALVNPAMVAPAVSVNAAVTPTASFVRTGVVPTQQVPVVTEIALPHSAIAAQSAGALFTPEATQASGRFGFAQATQRESEGSRPETSFGALRAAGKTLTAGVKSGALAALFTGETHSQAADLLPVSNGFAALASRGGRGLIRPVAASASPASFAGEIGHAEDALLTAPNGMPLDVRVSRTLEQDEKFLMNRTELPGDGVLSVVEGPGEFKLWLKNSLVPLDFVVLDGQGLVTSVHARLGPSPAKTHWKDIPLVPANGSFSLALPAGRAAELGAVVGARFSAAGSNISEPLDPEEAADMVLSGDLYAVSAAVEDFAGRERDDVRFDAVLTAAKSQLAHLEAARRPQARRTLVEFVSQVDSRMDTSGAYQGLFSNRFPALYFLNRYSRFPFLLPSGVIGSLISAGLTFIHEGGHYLAAKLFGLKVTAFKVFLNGAGYVRAEGQREGLRSALISWAGPAAGLAAAGLLLVFPAWLVYDLLATPQALPSPAAAAGAILATGISMLIAYIQWAGGVGDWINSLHALGFNKLAAEAAWRFEMVRQKRLSLGYTATWISLLTHPRLDTSTAPRAKADAGAQLLAEGSLPRN